MNSDKTLELISKELESDSDTKQENIIAAELEGIAKIKLEVSLFCHSPRIKIKRNKIIIG